MNPELAQKIKDCSALPSLPTVAMKVLELTRKDDVDIAEIAKVISRDAALSSKILRTVNSSFYGRSQKVGTISHAMVILGLQAVKTLVLGFSLITTMSKTKGKGFKHVEYWKRSIYAATAARTIAAKRKHPQAEECFLAGLLMDIGMLVLSQTLGERYAAVVEKAATHEDLAAIETAALGATHAEVTGLLAEHWNLPPVLALPMAAHHSAEQAEESVRPVARIIQLAGRCADVFVDAQPAGAIKRVRQLVAAIEGMAVTDGDLLLDEVNRRTGEAAPLFDIVIGNDTYDAILKKANERLIELTLTTQRQADELKAATSNLKVQNQQLKVQAITDGLTGLANRAAFDRYLSQQFAAAVRDRKPLALLMLDLDRFKLVNDTHGHPAGDAVLRAVGKLLGGVSAKGKLACRYGGEEFALILPNLGRAQATALAEGLRKAIAAAQVRFNNQSIPVTACFGVAVCEPSTPGAFREVAQLLKAADLSVYAAKHAGRNCVRVFAFKPGTGTQPSAA
jgi:two-component system, cell cycle response regulator